MGTVVEFQAEGNFYHDGGVKDTGVGIMDIQSEKWSLPFEQATIQCLCIINGFVGRSQLERIFQSICFHTKEDSRIRLTLLVVTAEDGW